MKKFLWGMFVGAVIEFVIMQAVGQRILNRSIVNEVENYLGSN